MPSDQSIDIAFSVPFTHRLRVTEDVAGDDFHVLRDLIDGGDAGPAKVLLVVESQVGQANPESVRIGQKLNASDGIDLVTAPIIMNGGEAIKNSTDCVKDLLTQINAHSLDRRSYIVAIGGGAMLDAVGCAAAIAHRGIRLVRLPTTTLAQADSGVGVKNAINYFDKKNWIGTFAVPWAVVNDTSLLESLPDRDFCSGFSEAVKVSLLKDESDFRWLCDHAQAIQQRDMPIAKRAIHRSCMLHLRHITEGGDPFEMQEARPLDFGHWSAHRLEPLTDYEIRHGEAVAIGVAIDCFYSSMKFGLREADAMSVCECLCGMGMQLWHDAVDPIDRLLEGLEEFRQHLGGRLTITMLRGVGNPINVHEVDPAVMRSSIEKLREVSANFCASSS
tara:strand:+ start:32095 stop:33261 length:1167 start_codon:yes stop_codon:yes gene_type:complete